MSRYIFISHDTIYTWETQMKNEHKLSKLLTATQRQDERHDNNKTQLAVNYSSDCSKKTWLNRAILALLNRLDQLERELNVKVSPISQAPTRCECEL